MESPCCSSSQTCSLQRPTTLGYRRLRWRSCGGQFNERTGTAFNSLQFPTDVVLLVVRWRLRYKLSLRDLAKMFLERGIAFTHEAVRECEARFAPLLTDVLRCGRRGLSARSWYVDETYVKLRGQWCYLYRAIDREGNLVDCRWSERRDLGAAQVFFRGATELTGTTPDSVTTDGHDSYPSAIRSELGEEVLHRTKRYLNNPIEQDHRGIRQRFRPVRGFGSFASSARFCRAHDELRNFYRLAAKRGEGVSLANRRRISQEKTAHVTGLLQQAA